MCLNFMFLKKLTPKIYVRLIMYTRSEIVSGNIIHHDSLCVEYFKTEDIMAHL